MEQTNFSSVLCDTVRTTMSSEWILGDFCDALYLSVSEKIGVGLALGDSENLDISTRGKNFCMGQIEELLKNYGPVDSAEQIQDIFMFLCRAKGFSKHVDSFLENLSLMELKETTPLILAPLLSDDLCQPSRNPQLVCGRRDDEFDTILAEMETETSMAGTMREQGYGCTIDVLHCKEVLSLFSPLTEATVSRVLATLAHTHRSLDDDENLFMTFCSAVGVSAASEALSAGSWNANVFADSIKQLSPEINWILVMENLDHEGFYLPNEEAFIFLMSVYAHACQDPFPLHAICGSVWKNIDGQISLLRYAVSAPPEVFTFGHSPRRLACSDTVHGYEGHDAWLSLDLMEVFCQLAERGYQEFVREALKFPLKQCPEVLLLGIAQINTAYNLLQYEVSSIVLPMIVGNGRKNGVILQLWSFNPNLVLRGLVDMIEADQGCVEMVLNLCQELKILLSLLEQIPFCFSIRLAALSSVKGYINIERWLNDNLSTYKDVFFEACIKFLKDIFFVAPEVVSTNSFQHTGSAANLYAKISPIFTKVMFLPELSCGLFKLLSTCHGFLWMRALQVLEENIRLISSKELLEELKMLNESSRHGLRTHNVGACHPSTSDGNDIQADANSYFQQLFSGQLSVDAMVQMLASFKESSESRKQSIFECMIQNLFEEYRFFFKFPEIELNIVAALVGSLIKHQLVTHLTLGIALRSVLDALRKPTDTKIFAFGTVALEQFLDRLVEWPQYCNHILQISHLCGAHPELVSFIEHTLARISSGRLEPNVSSSFHRDPQSDPFLAPVESIEVENEFATLSFTNI
ncbi:hypothetical protein RJ640_022836 [Escallonia rubra]|uniref:Uncharacterized protein n=1 Tax=Escallonia rubra TaxID=112253 RepID=A0AA88R0T5_9ASTE|nr:hypothetical protein RJ640_022836 [Escallonia rubra]